MMKIDVPASYQFIKITHRLNFICLIFMLKIYLNKLQRKTLNLIILRRKIKAIQSIIVLQIALHCKKTLLIFPSQFIQRIQNFHRKQVHLVKCFLLAMLLQENKLSSHLDHPAPLKSIFLIWYRFLKPH
jgi:hypothetical protein